MKKRRLWMLGTIIVLAAAAFVAYRVWASSQSENSETEETAIVERGSITSTLSSSGNSRTGQTAEIAWQTAGQIGVVTLKPGDTVAKDQVIAALDLDSPTKEMIQARQELADAQQALADLQNSTLQQANALQALEEAQAKLDDVNKAAAEEKSQAQLALANAQEALEDAQRTRNKMNYPHSTDKLIIEKAETDYLLAKLDYKEALKQYNLYAKKNLTNPDRVLALNRLVAAEQKMKTSLATYNWYTLGYTQVEIAQADASLALAQANLELAQAEWDRLKDGASTSAIALAEASLNDAQREWEREKDGPAEVDIAAAQARLASAQAVIDEFELRAPFDGTITELDATSNRSPRKFERQ